MKLYATLLFVLMLTTAAYAQGGGGGGGSTPYPQATPNPAIENQQTNEAIQRSEDLNARSDSLRLTQNLPAEVPENRSKFLESIKPLYRESTDEEKSFMAPDDDILAEYGSFLSSKNTGIFRLRMDRGCADSSKVVNASDACKGYTMPGAGAAYSFRFEDYRMHHLADIKFAGMKFEALGVMNHGIMIDLGDTPIDQVSLSTEGMEFLQTVKPTKDFESAANLATRLQQGINSGGRIYASVLPVKADTTYAIRTIAYRGEVLRNVAGVTYNELELDDRKDLIVVFRVVSLTENEEATIVWRELDKNKSPKLKPDK